MLAPDYLSHVADDIVSLYEEYENSLIVDMVRRILNIGVSVTSVGQMAAYQAAGGVYDDAIRQLAAVSGQSQQVLRKAFEEAGAQTLKYDDAIYRRAGLTPLPFSQSSVMLQMLLAGLQKTGGTLNNLTMTTAVASQTAFINALNVAYLQVSSGAMSYTQAILGSLKKLANEGEYVMYPSGHRDRMDVAVRRAVLTGVVQTCGQLQWMRADEMSCDLVETTAHLGARPTHALWQGRVCSRSGTDPRYPDFVSFTGYGTGAGLMGWNCRHGYFPYFDGLSLPNYTDEQLADMSNATVNYDDDEIPLYQATQMQRALEREIRATKRELIAMEEAAKSKDASTATQAMADFETLSALLRGQRDRLADFTNQTGLVPQPERTQVFGYGRDIARRARWAAYYAS